jgi:hypothetical protein
VAQLNLEWKRSWCRHNVTVRGQQANERTATNHTHILQVLKLRSQTNAIHDNTLRTSRQVILRNENSSCRPAAHSSTALDTVLDWVVRGEDILDLLQRKRLGLREEEPDHHGLKHVPDREDEVHCGISNVSPEP